MASSLIHISIASEINKELKRNPSKLLIGTIAPDISKLVGESKVKSHFLDFVGDDTPDLERFLEKYKNNLDDDFVMGYYIHLYTDYLWFKYFLTEINYNNMITTLEGNQIECTQDELFKYIYNDYTNLNIELIDRYNLDCKIFYNELPKFNSIIEEIPMDKIKIIVDQAGIILENSTDDKELLFNLENIEKFIETSKEIILSNIKEIMKD